MPVKRLLTLAALACALAQAQAPGGFLEPATSQSVRPRLTAAQIAALLPARGPFTFTTPYLTQASRITTGADCGGSDCVLPVGYSYWRNMNNHVGRAKILMFLGLDASHGGTGPTLFEYDKQTGAVVNRGPMFDASSPYRWSTAEGWYFSGTRPTALYLIDQAKLRRYDVETHAMQTVFDAATRYGSDKYVWQPHSSDDDRVHSVTLRDKATSTMLGCLLYREDTATYQYYPKRGDFDECSVDKSGQWLLIIENVDSRYGVDNRIINVDTGVESVLLDENGAAGHNDMGNGYVVGEDDWANESGTARLWKLGEPLIQSATQGIPVYHTTSWSADLGHLSHGNAKRGVATGQQFACSSNATRLDLPRSNEIVCYRLDGTQQVLVVAPVMTDLAMAGGGDDYSKHPKGNLDVTGQYFMWTSNMGGSRLDAFVVRVPSDKLVAGSSSDDSSGGSGTGSGTGTGTGGNAVLWTNLLHTSASGGTLTKTSGVDEMDDARAVSQQRILSGAGSIEFTATDITTTRFAGLTTGTGGAGYAWIAFAIRLGPWTATAGTAEVRERGVWRADVSYVAGDRFRVAVDAGRVRYYKNGTLFYTSLRTPAYPMRGDSSIFSLGASIDSATFKLGR